MRLDLPTYPKIWRHIWMLPYMVCETNLKKKHSVILLYKYPYCTCKHFNWMVGNHKSGLIFTHRYESKGTWFLNLTTLHFKSKARQKYKKSLDFLSCIQIRLKFSCLLIFNLNNTKKTVWDNFRLAQNNVIRRLIVDNIGLELY